MRMVVTLVVETETPNTVINSVLKATKLLTVCELHVAEVPEFEDYEDDDDDQSIDEVASYPVLPSISDATQMAKKSSRLVQLRD